MDNTERSDSVYVNTEEVENPNFIKNKGEAVGTSSNLPPQRKKSLNDPSGHESDGCTSKRFKIVSEESCWSCQGQKILIELKSWMTFYWGYLNKRKNSGYHDRWYIWKNSRKGNSFYGSIIQIIRPYEEVVSSTISGWVKTVLKLAGVDLNTFKGHSTRVASAYLDCEMLERGSWSSASTWQRFKKKKTLFPQQ